MESYGSGMESFVLAKPLLANGSDAAKFNFDPVYNNLYKRQPIR